MEGGSGFAFGSTVDAGGGGEDFFGDIARLIGFEIHRQIDAFGFDIYPYHAKAGRANLEVGGDIAFFVDAHGYSPSDQRRD